MNGISDPSPTADSRQIVVGGRRDRGVPIFRRMKRKLFPGPQVDSIRMQYIGNPSSAIDRGKPRVIAF